MQTYIPHLSIWSAALAKAPSLSSKSQPWRCGKVWPKLGYPLRKRWHNYAKSRRFIMEKLTISMAIFNSYVQLPVHEKFSLSVYTLVQAAGTVIMSRWSAPSAALSRLHGGLSPGIVCQPLLQIVFWDESPDPFRRRGSGSHPWKISPGVFPQKIWSIWYTVIPWYTVYPIHATGPREHHGWWLSKQLNMLDHFTWMIFGNNRVVPSKKLTFSTHPTGDPPWIPAFPSPKSSSLASQSFAGAPAMPWSCERWCTNGPPWKRPTISECVYGNRQNYGEKKVQLRQDIPVSVFFHN